MTQASYDVIVVGAGTAGCLLAHRLSEDPSRRVLLVEAGQRPRSLWVDMPAGVSRLIFPGPYTWGFHTEPEPELEGRRIYAPRGRGVGGSSLINGMAFFRGQPADYDAWAAAVDGWSWTEVLPHYKTFERREGAPSPWRGERGGLVISDPRFVHPASRDFVAAGVACGLSENIDFNGASAEGIGLIQFNIADGRRHSSGRAFIDPVLGRRPNLELLTGAQVTRITLERDRATGIEVAEGGRNRRTISAAEVVLAAGAFGSPQLLQLSGLGDPTLLQACGVRATHALVGVGANLQDHLYVHHTFDSTLEGSMNRSLRGWRAYLHGARYLLDRRGPLTTGASQACAFVRSGDDIDRADLQINFRPVSWRFTPGGTMEIGRTPQITVSVCHLRPSSRGRVQLASSDPLAAPRIRAGYLSAAGDREIVVRAVRQVRRLLATEPVARYVRNEIEPGPKALDDGAILAYVRATAQSMHHWCGTCRMGRSDDPDAVVDSRLRVHGISGLRVADASVFPAIVSANTNAASFLVAERAAHFMHPLQQETAA